MKKISLYILTSTFIITSCGGGGGGGGGGSSTPTPPSNPAPVVNFSASASTAATGELVTLNWSSSNANSCTASGSNDWSGDKGTSGSGDVKIAYGNNTFSLSCSGSGGTTSRNVTVQGTQIYNESVFVPLGETKTFAGYIFNKEDGTAGCLSSVEISVTNNDNFLSINDLLTNEWRYIGYREDENGNQLGLELSPDTLGDENNPSGTSRRVTITDSTLNGIDVSDVQINPYDYEVNSVDDLEKFSADIVIDTDYENGLYCVPDIQMGLFAVPNSSSTSPDGAFIGVLSTTNSYTFMYLAAKDYWDSYSDNLPSESDIFGKNWVDWNVFTSYMSNPNIEIDDYGFIVNSAEISSASNTSQAQIATLVGSRLADSINVSDNSLWFTNEHAIKYFYSASDSFSNQRIYLKSDISGDCLRSYSQYRTCAITNYEILFFSPEKEGLIGFSMGGYDNFSHNSKVKLIFNND